MRFPNKRLGWLTLVALTLVLAGAVYRLPRRERLRTIEAGGKGPPTLVLLHGFGAHPEEWSSFGREVAFLPDMRFVYPQGPASVFRPDGKRDGYAWWNFEPEQYRRVGKPGLDLRNLDPAGLIGAEVIVQSLLKQLGGGHGDRMILGGSSQGAIVSCQVAFGTDEPLAALILLSGTPVNESAWRAGMAKRKGLHVFMSHGRSDDVLPFDLAEELRDTMVAAGLDVTFFPFNGGHDVPHDVVIAVRDFLKHLGLGRGP